MILHEIHYIMKRFTHFLSLLAKKSLQGLLMRIHLNTLVINSYNTLSDTYKSSKSIASLMLPIKNFVKSMNFDYYYKLSNNFQKRKTKLKFIKRMDIHSSLKENYVYYLQLPILNQRLVMLQN